MSRLYGMLAFALVVTFISITIPGGAHGGLVGGWTDPRKPSELKAYPKVQALMNTAEEAVSNRTGVTYCKFKLVSFRTQIVNGINFYLKFDVGKKVYVHLRVYKSFRGEPVLQAYCIKKKRGDCFRKYNKFK